MKLPPRRAGVVLHITSRPGPHGIGDFGPAARHFVNWLAGCGQSLWQLLPTTPIGPGHSPYQSVSAFAGSPLMVSLEPLIECGWLGRPALPKGGFESRRVDYDRVVPWRLAQLRAAHAGFRARAEQADLQAMTRWCDAQAHWLDDYTLFMALQTAQGGAPWWQWAPAFRTREPAALAAARREHADEIAFWQFVQWCFDIQGAKLKAYANQRGVALMGDLPIFVAHDIDFAPLRQG
jgi:4-alpha-glucanotransferase